MAGDLAALIRRLHDTKPLSKSEASALSRSERDRMLAKAMKMGDRLNEPGALIEFIRAERSDLSILNQPEDAFRAELKSIDNDLDRQIELVNEGLDGWFKAGAIAPPYYAWRIAIILGREKRLEEEKAFLAGWCRHFGNTVGARFEALEARARKKGAI